MTTTTSHGQVPDTLIDLIDTYAETRYRYGGIYNAKTEAARNAVIEALSEVQALSAAPAGWKLVPEDATEEMVRATDKVNFANADTDGTLHNVWNVMLAATPTLPAEQQATTKAAPGEPSAHQILAITTAYEQGVGKGHQAYKSGKEIANPYDSAYGCDLAWHYGYGEGKEQAQRATKAAPVPAAPTSPAFVYTGERGSDLEGLLDGYDHGTAFYTSPQPAPAPLSEMPYEKRKAIQEGEQIGASDAWFKARHEMLDTVDRRNVFRAGFDRGWNAALAAQGGKDAG